MKSKGSDSSSSSSSSDSDDKSVRSRSPRGVKTRLLGVPNVSSASSSSAVPAVVSTTTNTTPTLVVDESAVPPVVVESATPPEATSKTSPNPELSRPLRDLVAKVHGNLGHPSNASFVKMLVAAGARKDVVEWVRTVFKCEACESNSLPGRHRPATIPRTMCSTRLWH